ncbi:MAG: hypothetical protein J2P24_00300 [Streptosporangiales bacterium]|nr:hypothetical protein [Streptosporangiales bacterium]
MNSEQFWTGLVMFIFGGGLMVSIQRGVKAWRDVKAGKLADTGSVLDRLEVENKRQTATITAERDRADKAEADAERERKRRLAAEMRAARLELQIVRLGHEPEGGIGGVDHT